MSRLISAAWERVWARFGRIGFLVAVARSSKTASPTSWGRMNSIVGLGIGIGSFAIMAVFFEGGCCCNTVVADCFLGCAGSRSARAPANTPIEQSTEDRLAAA